MKYTGTILASLLLTPLAGLLADEGRSTPGAPQKNYTTLDIFRGQKIKTGGGDTE